MYTDSSCKLCDSGNGGFYFFSGCHDEVGKFVNNDNDVGQVFMPVVGIQLSFYEFFVVFFDVSDLCYFKQVITGVHFNAQRVECIDYFSCFGDNGFFFVG